MCTEFSNERKIKSADSDVTTAMMASMKFNRILQEVQASHLNFQFQLSPFSAVISIKKSFVKEKDGSIHLPSLLCDKVSESDSDAL